MPIRTVGDEKFMATENCTLIIGTGKTGTTRQTLMALTHYKSTLIGELN